LVAVSVAGYLIYDEAKTQSEWKNGIEVATKNYEITQENVVKSSLDLYYVKKGEYPRRNDKLVEELKKIDGLKIDELEKAINTLKDFKYQLRGDEEAYQFSYTDSSGQKHTVEGEYKKNFHN
jgi:hypothetical protein